MRDIQFLDCTLRDGAHVVSGEFQYARIIDVINKLTAANADIIEFGFLQMGSYDRDKVYYPHVEDAYRILDQTKHGHETIYSLMLRADEYDIRELSKADGRIGLIRDAFYYDFMDQGIETARKVMEKGYYCSLNLINTPGATIEELKVFIDKANDICPFAVSLVDTFGILNLEELERIIRLYDDRLDKKIRIGLHVHENFSLTFALAQTFLNITTEGRKMIIDGSLMGIGRSPGNLCSELIANYLNDSYGKKYDIGKMMNAISEDIQPLKNHFKWGYAPEFFLSAKYRVHRSYAEYLAGRGVRLEHIGYLLNIIDSAHKEKFNKNYIEHLAKEKRLL